MCRTVRYLAVALATVAAAPGAAAAQQNEKHVFVTVLDKSGLPVEGLTTEHFAIMESGRERPVVKAEPLRVPMHVVVLVDTSGVNAAVDETFRSAVLTFIERLAATNHVAVYGIGDRATQVAPFTQDAAKLRSAVTGMFGWAHTRSALIDGIEAALTELGKVEPARPVIIAVNAETPEASGRSAGSVIKKLIAQSTAFHSISLASSSAGGASRIQMSSTDPSGMNIGASSQALKGMAAAGEGDRERNQMLSQGPSTTGGSRQRVTTTMALGPALHRLGNELSNSYRVTFTRSGSDRIRDLQVGLFLDDVTVRVTAAPFGTR